MEENIVTTTTVTTTKKEEVVDSNISPIIKEEPKSFLGNMMEDNSGGISSIRILMLMWGLEYFSSGQQFVLHQCLMEYMLCLLYQQKLLLFY